MSVRFLLQRRWRTARNLRITPVKLYSSSALAIHGDSELVKTTVKPFSAIPGPKPLPLLRNALEFKKNLQRLHVYFEECHEKYGEIFKLEAPGRPVDMCTRSVSLLLPCFTSCPTRWKQLCSCIWSERDWEGAETGREVPEERSTPFIKLSMDH